MTLSFTTRRLIENDWQALRELRIRAIRDTPIAFLETLAAALAVDEAGWRERARRGMQPDSAQFVAVGADGWWIGSMMCFISDGPPPYLGREPGGPRRANLVGVFVDPEWRGGAGVTDALLDAITTWVRDDRGLDALWLHVSAANPRAQRAYEKRGFESTGVVEQIPDDPSGPHVEMILRIASSAGGTL